MLKILPLLLLLLVSCAQKPEEKITEAIDVAQTLLSQEKCQEAIDLLEEVKRHPDDPIYLQVLASAYACRADFRAIDFIANEIPLINSAALMKSLSVLTLSTQTVADDEAYTDLKEAISILTLTDKQSARNTKFGPRKAGDMGVQLLLLSVTQLGKYLHFFGNVNGTGVKGGGSNSNSCFINYIDASAVTFVTTGGQTGACTSAVDGHPDMTGSDLIRRLCEGSTLIANIIDVLDHVDLSGSSELDDLENINTAIAAYRTQATTFSVSHLLDLTSQSQCEALLTNATEMNNMQKFFAGIFEKGLQ